MIQVLQVLIDKDRIPLDRALQLANKERITDLCYPIFVRNLSALLYDPVNDVTKEGLIKHAAARAYGLSKTFGSTDPMADKKLPDPHFLPTARSVDKASPLSADSPGLSSSSMSPPLMPARTPPTAQSVVEDSPLSAGSPGLVSWHLLPEPTVTPPPELVVSPRSHQVVPQVKPSPTTATTSTNSAKSLSFPVLGLSDLRHGRNGSSSTGYSSPSHSSCEEYKSGRVTPSTNPNSAISDVSSTWTEHLQESKMLRSISMSCKILILVYLKFVARRAPSNYKTHGVKKTKTTQDSSKQQQSLQEPSSKRRRVRKQKQNSHESDDGDDVSRSKRRRYDSNGLTKLEDRPLACPFNKYDNRLFGPDSTDESYHACSTCSFVNVAHLK